MNPSPASLQGRNQEILALRQQGKTYGEIGTLTGLTRQRVHQILNKHGPHPTGLGHALGRHRKHPNAPRPTDDPRSYRRWYYYNVVKPRARLAKIKGGVSLRAAAAHHVNGLGPTLAAPPTVTNLPIELVQPDHERHLRLATSAEDDQLRHSIERWGILAPLVVSSAGKGQYVIIDGARRFHIAQALGFKSITCVVNHEMDSATREGIRFQLEGTFKPLASTERVLQWQRLQAFRV